jgi:hypothetical protein
VDAGGAPVRSGYGAVAVAQARAPLGISAHNVPAQQLPDIGSQASPAAMHTGSPADPAAMHAPEPGGPMQDPLQQSSGAEQPAPTGAQASRQA